MNPLLLTVGGFATAAVATPLLATLAVLGAPGAPSCPPEEPAPIPPASTSSASSTSSVTSASGSHEPGDCVGGTAASLVGSAPRRPAEAINAALAMTGTRNGWHRLCDRLVCRTYGYANSGYPSAIAHWTAMEHARLAHPGDRCPPPGSFVFWDTGTGEPGHVALVISRASCNPNQITAVSNDVLDTAVGNRGGVYHVTLARLESGFVRPSRYLGWSPPVCAGLALPTSSTTTVSASSNTE
jgi:hypothetical protein